MGDAASTPTLEERAPWMAQIPVGDRGEDFAKLGSTFPEFAKNVRTIIKEHAELKAKVGPKPGVPEKPEGYAFTFPQDFPEELKRPEDTKGFAALALELKLDGKEAQRLVDFETARTVSARKAYADLQKENAKKVRDELQTEYKEKAEERLAGAFTLVEKFGGKELKDELDATGLGNNPRLIKMLVKIGTLFTEKGITASSSGGGTGAADEGPDLKEVYKKSYLTGAMH
jgi:hypothetical protein